MTATAAIQGDYVDLRFVKGRKVCQVVIEIPIEAGESFVAAFGTPNPAHGIPVALARIQPVAAEPERKQWDDLSLAQQAGILCSDRQFHAFLGCHSPDSAAIMLRHKCGVVSRSDLDKNPDAARKFRELNSSYRASLRGAA